MTSSLKKLASFDSIPDKKESRMMYHQGRGRIKIKKSQHAVGVSQTPLPRGLCDGCNRIVPIKQDGGTWIHKNLMTAEVCEHSGLPPYRIFMRCPAGHAANYSPTLKTINTHHTSSFGQVCPYSLAPVMCDYKGNAIKVWDGVGNWEDV